MNYIIIKGRMHISGSTRYDPAQVIFEQLNRKRFIRPYIVTEQKGSVQYGKNKAGSVYDGVRNDF